MVKKSLVDLYTKQKTQEILGIFIDGALEAIRTPDLRLRRQLLYPAELRAHDH